jgi:exportin-2 (importin alpha re-exporter)
VRLIKAYLSQDAASVIANNQLPQILGVVQQRLIPSKLNDQYGLELLEAVVTHVTLSELQKHFRAVVLTLLNRMQTTRTDKYAHGFTRFLCFMMASKASGLTPDFTISTTESIQTGCVLLLWTIPPES